MKKFLLVILLLVLAACVPEPALPEMAKEASAESQAIPAERVIPQIRTSVFHLRGSERVLWGYGPEGRLVLFNGTSKSAVFEYDRDGKLAVIDDGVEPLRFFYDNSGRLLSAQKGGRRWLFAYSSRGKLVSVEDGEKLVVTHDSKGRLSSVARGKGPSTEFVYDGLNRTESFRKGAIETLLFYDDNGRLALFGREDDHLVLGYWRENLLSSLSGTMYGLKETVNYGASAITLVSNVEESVFETAYPDESAARMDAFNTFLFCTRFRKLPVVFDGQSWVLYREYMKGNITDYLMLAFVCDAIR